MDITKATHDIPKALSFGFYTNAQLLQHSVKEITTPQIFNDLLRPAQNGLYDPALGPLSLSARCQTCNALGFDCPGHFGHISLPVPVFNPLCFTTMMLLLKGCCLGCHRLMASRLEKGLVQAKLRLLHLGRVQEALELEGEIDGQPDLDEAVECCSVEGGGKGASTAALEKIKKLSKFIASLPEPEADEASNSNLIHQSVTKIVKQFLSPKASRKCPHCLTLNPNLKAVQGTKVIETSRGSSLRSSLQLAGGKKSAEPLVEADEKQRFLSPLKAQEYFKALWKNENALLTEIFGPESSYEMFFFNTLIVPPTRYRPLNAVGDQSFEHPQNTYLTEILRISARIRELQRKLPAPPVKQLLDAWVQLQQQCNFFQDSSKNNSMVSGKEPPAGIKQLFEKKEGLFRKHMMGKRVNFSARTVISPDPNIECGEIGIPQVFASKLTYPECVTKFNFPFLRQSVINGPFAYPGASHVQEENGKLHDLSVLEQEARIALANQLLTTSPSCANMEGIPKKVFRNLQNGDVVLVNRQPTLHRPSIMAHRCRVLEGERVLRMHYANCNSYNADFDGDEMNIHFLQNEIARAEGYFVASTDNQYLVPTDGSPIRDLIQDHVGSAVWLTLKDTFLERDQFQQLLYGAFPETGKIITLPPAIQRPKALWTGKQLISTLLANILPGKSQPLTFTSRCKVPARLWPTPEEATLRVLHGDLLTGVLDKSQIGSSAFGFVHALQELYSGAVANLFLSSLGKMLTKYLQATAYTCRLDDMMLKEEANATRFEIIKKATSIGQAVFSKHTGQPTANELGTKVAYERISRSPEALGALDGAMRGAMNSITSEIIDSCLPSGQLIPFPHNHMSLMTVTGAKGSNVNFSQISCLLGQQELEGKRVPLMSSGKSLPAFLPFDTSAHAGGFITSRFLTGVGPTEFFFHCMAGREGLIDTAIKTARSGYLQRCLVKHLESLRVAYDSTVRGCDNSVVQFFYGEDGLDILKQMYIQGKMDFVVGNFNVYLDKYKPFAVLSHLDTVSAVEDQAGLTMSKYHPTNTLGSVSEAYSTELEVFIADNSKLFEPHSKLTVKKFRALMWLKYLNSLVDPGEAVGLLAAQSIGEPSTQMTLNTFHLAGIGGGNVTLGIPRLREIIMTAAKVLSTPTMHLALSSEAAAKGIDLELLANSISKCTLKTIMRSVRVVERLLPKQNGIREREYLISIFLIPLAEAKTKYGVTAASIKSLLEDSLCKTLLVSIVKLIKKKASVELDAVVRRSVAAEAAEREEPEENAEDDAGIQKALDSQMQEAEREERKVQESEESEGEGESESEEEKEEANAAEIETEEPTTTTNPSVFKHQFLKEAKYLQNEDTLSIRIALPASAPKLQMLECVEAICSQLTIHQIPGISRCIPLPPTANSQFQLVTQGVSLRGIWDLCGEGPIDHRTLQTNDIHAMASVYGIEAARATLVREIGSVFDAYGISVDRRHLLLIGDAMTQDGTYRPFNRTGMEGLDSPLMQMSFETTMHFMKGAAVFGAQDGLESPSSRLVMGLPVKVGTGALSMMNKVD